MNVTEILEALPHLTLSERRVLFTRLEELEFEQETRDFCDMLSLQAVQMLDEAEGKMPGALKSEA